ncbi:SMC-Scp complex subunit ScpB [Actinokineospora xionganensis]|uniref:SMC-Scp complex subunit ScpB n=1 Tax=Actinokineospora xionganensis TaxID=2684470 RepID=A0ABR7LGA0_9PSEU|nr:SMC-Scp complex subunit ScpB [Actinokineospora xionganensis]MBC6451399.1 SMC-Scp complex subunit ScpB [Actinokineospora xionganensis]
MSPVDDTAPTEATTEESTAHNGEHRSGGESAALVGERRSAGDGVPASAAGESTALASERRSAEDDIPARAAGESTAHNGEHRSAPDETPAALAGESPNTGEAGEPDPADVLTEDDLVTIGSQFPDLTEDADLDAALEALLLVVDAPAEDELLAGAVDQSVARVREALRRMAARYTEQGSGIDLRRVGQGWRFYTRDRYAPVVEKLLLDGQRAKLTRAALETLAVIAYRQPVTRSRVAAVRGVNVDGVIRTLVVRGLIEETGTDTETGGLLYRTTELFLERLGLASLEDLPPIAPLLPEVDAIDDVE